MTWVPRRFAGWSAVTALIAMVPTLSAATLFLSSERITRDHTIPTKGQSDEGRSSSWVILNAACEKAYQEHAYRDSAAIGLLAYLTASVLEDHTRMFRSAQMTAFSYHFQGDTDSALAAYRLTLDCIIPGVPVSMSTEQDNPKLAALDTDQNAAKTLMNVGVLCVNARKLDAGEIYFLRTIRLAEQEEPRTEVGKFLVKHLVARAKTGLADVYQDKNIYDKAINLYEESREVFQAELRYFQFRERIHANHAALAAMLQATRMNLGHCLRSLGEAYFQGPEPNFAEAREKLEESLRLRREIGGNIFIADSEIALCELALAERRYGDALILSTSAANLTAPGSEGDNPDIRWQALLAEGQSLLDLGRLNDAAAPLKMAIQVVESLKDPDLGTGEKPSFFNSITWFFRQKVAPYIAMAELCVRQDRPVEALRYAELAKARTLLLGRPMAAVTREDSLGSTTVSPEELAHVLSTSVPDDKTAALEYMFGADCGYAFLVTRAKADDQPTVKVATFATEKPPGGFTGDNSVARSIANLDSAIEIFRSKIEKSYTAYPRALANSLYEELVKRFEKELATKERLIVVPTGKLWRIPFEALSTSKNGNLSYLIENFAISYVPSLSFLTRIIDRSKGEHQSISSNSLVLTDPVISEQQLTSNNSNAASLASVFSNQPHFFHGKSFAGTEATRQHFLREAPANKLILIATHAVVGGDNPVESYFAVTPEPSADPNGRLTAADIMTEQLSANLVVLSGCETELGRYVEGEGEVGSGWAFLYAGCASTLVCQWRVDRDATLKLTAGFCHALDQRLLSSSAEVSLAGLLRSTRLAILADERYSHPFFWAGMVLVGDSFWRSPATSVGER